MSLILEFFCPNLRPSVTTIVYFIDPAQLASVKAEHYQDVPSV